MVHLVEPTTSVVQWVVKAPKIRNVPPLLADPPPMSDGDMFVPAAVVVRYVSTGHLLRSPRGWSCAEVVLSRRDGDCVTTRTFTSFADLPAWAEKFVTENHPYARVMR